MRGLWNDNRERERETKRERETDRQTDKERQTDWHTHTHTHTHTRVRYLCRRGERSKDVHDDRVDIPAGGGEEGERTRKESGVDGLLGVDEWVVRMVRTSSGGARRGRVRMEGTSSGGVRGEVRMEWTSLGEGRRGGARW